MGSLYTFGQVRVGNHKFASRFSTVMAGRYYRVTHGRDPIVLLPDGPKLPLPHNTDFTHKDFYVHATPEVFYKGTVVDGYIICNTTESVLCSAQYTPSSVQLSQFLAVILAPSLLQMDEGFTYHTTYMDRPTTPSSCEIEEHASEAP